MDETLAKLNNRITKTFKNPNITFFIIMVLILFISCYTFISEPIKNTISYIVSNPIMIVIIIAAILFIAQFNMIIALLSLVLLFISLYSFGAGNNLYSSPQIERFTSNQESPDDDPNDDPNDDSDEPDLDGIIELPTKRESTSRLEKNLNVKKANDDEMDSKVRSIKDTILGTINKYRENNDDDYKRAILENKRKMYQSERNRNSNKNNSGNSDGGSGNGKEKFGNTSGGSRKSGKGKERFQTIEPRKFDPSNEEDTNLLITKEILEDMNNRIQYNYENNKYLKKYIKHRVEEIIDVNKLTED